LPPRPAASIFRGDRQGESRAGRTLSDDAIPETAMRNAHSTLRFVALVTAVVGAAACGGETAQTADSAAAAPPPAPAPESFALVGEDGSWSVDITPANIVWRQKKGARTDSVVFDYKAPSVNGAFYEYESLRLANDTTRISINLAMVKCNDKAGAEYTHKAQVWLTGGVTATVAGCGTKK
jgi:hypothetical protein